MAITKEWFIETIKELEKIQEEEIKNDGILSDMWGCHVVIPNPLWTTINKIFTQIIGEDIVGYYLWEDSRLVVDKDGKEWHLDTPEQLWEYVCHFCDSKLIQQ